MGFPRNLPSRVLAELSDAVDRTGLTLQLARAVDVLHTLFDLTPAEVEEWFFLQGQADAIRAAGIREDMDEYEFTPDACQEKSFLL